MNGAMQTKVMLVCEATGIPREFEISHAERLLSMPRCGWQLEKDYVFEDGSISRRSKERVPRTGKKAVD
jgi:hypothetical protein